MAAVRLLLGTLADVELVATDTSLKTKLSIHASLRMLGSSTRTSNLE